MTTLLVQTDRIKHNLTTFQRAVGNTAVIPVIGANAFGLGDTSVAGLLAAQGVSTVAVTRLDEAERIIPMLRGTEVLLMASYDTQAEAERIVQSGATASVGSIESAVLLSGVARRKKTRVQVHLEFDVGRGRYGFLPREASKVAQTIQNLNNIDVTGVYAHLAVRSVKKEKKVRAQFMLLQSAVEVLRREKIGCGTVHLADTGAALLYPWLRLDAVRAGSALTGRIEIKDTWGFKKVGRVVSNINSVRWLPAGASVGKSIVRKVGKPTRIAVVPVGYTDGIFMETQNKGAGLFKRKKLYCEVNGSRAQIIGPVGPTSLTVDVTDIDCTAGNRVTFDTNPIFVNAAMRRDYV